MYSDDNFSAMKRRGFIANGPEVASSTVAQADSSPVRAAIDRAYMAAGTLDENVNELLRRIDLVLRPPIEEVMDNRNAVGETEPVACSLALSFAAVADQNARTSQRIYEALRRLEL